jgi:hypothetical protein
VRPGQSVENDPKATFAGRFRRASSLSRDDALSSAQRETMRRRNFITLISGAASVWPHTAHAQPDGKRPTIGFLAASSDSAWAAQVSSFNQRLRELGWVDGRTVSIVYRWAEGKLDRYSDFAAEFVRLKVDVIVTVGSAIPAVKRASRSVKPARSPSSCRAWTMKIPTQIASCQR